MALDGAISGPASLDVAVDLAMRFRAELMGLFVEDTDLLSLAALPFSAQVNLSTAAAHPLEHDDLERAFVARAAAVRRDLSDAAARRQVKWSFRTVRGRAASELSAAAADADLVVVEGGRQGVRRYENIGLSPRIALMRVSRSLLILRADRQFTRSVVAVYDGSVLSRKALSAVAGFVGHGDRVTVLLRADPSHPVTGLEADARTALGAASRAADFEPTSAWDLSSLCAQMTGRDPGLIVLGADSSLAPAGTADNANGHDIQRLLDTMKCPVWIVR
jgi:hypothetical protein